jgi:putative transposase
MGVTGAPAGGGVPVCAANSTLTVREGCGEKRWLWRAVDQDGYVIDEIVQNRRDGKAATRLLKSLLKKQGLAPKRIVTGKLGSYAVARRAVMPKVEHRAHKGLKQPRRKCTRPVTKAGAGDARHSVMVWRTAI